MQIVVVAGFVVVVSLMPTSGSAEAAPWWALVACAAGYVGLSYGVTRWNTDFGLRRLMRSGGAGAWLGRWPVIIALATQVYLVAAAGGLMLAGWGSLFTDTLHLGRCPLVAKLLALAPFVVALIVHWWAIYPLEQAVRNHVRRELALAGEPVAAGWSRRQFLSFNVRHHLLFVAVPVAIIVFVVDVLILMEAAKWLRPAVATAVGLTVSGGVFLAAPAMIVRIWRTRPLPEGPLRARLEGLCRRMGLGYRQILVWDTGGVIVNAGVMGLLGRLRYVLLSDALLAHLDQDAVEAVFAHEAGHAVHRHIPYMVLFTCGLLLTCAALAGAAAAALGAGEVPAAVQLSTLLLAGLLWGVPFGILSRRFERQADVFAASAVGADDPDGRQDRGALTVRGVSVFGNALLAVARLNGISPSRRNYRHGSILARVNYLGWLLAGGLGPAAVDRGVRRIKLAVWVLFVAGVLMRLAPLLP